MFADGLHVTLFDEGKVMAKVSDAETVLREATGIKPKAKEDRQDYLKRLSLKAQDLQDKAWDNLGDGAQAWCNAAAKSIDADKDIKEFGGAEGEGGDEEDEKPAKKTAKSTRTTSKKDEEEDDKPAKKVAKDESEDEEDDDKPARKAKEPKEKEPRKPRELKEGGVKVRIKKLILADPAITPKEIVTELSKDGSTPSEFTVASIRAEFRHSLKFLIAEGALGSKYADLTV